MILAFPAEVFAQHDINFSDGWRFVRDSLITASDPAYDDSEWTVVNLPHDFSMLEAEDEGHVGPFSPKSVGGNHTGHVVGGTGWYRKHLILSKKQSGSRVILDFDGAYMETTVWVNGQQAAEHKYGYTPFLVDITSLLNKAGEDNVIVVKVENNGANSRWYSGSGLYRNVRLNILPQQHLAPWGINVTTREIASSSATIDVTITAENASKACKTPLKLDICDAQGNEVASETLYVSLPEGTSSHSITMTVNNPKLWNAEHPELYTAKASLGKGSKADTEELRFGIRTIEYSAEKGLLINGEPELLRGGCMHHDNGFLGAAAIRRAEYRRVELMKQNGFNAIRCSHNPPSREFLDACDELGIYVIDEFTDMWSYYKNKNDYARFFPTHWQQDLTDMILRDRHHPSVIMWSIGNEIPMLSGEEAEAQAKELVAHVKSLDSTRPVTQGVPSFLIPGGWKKSDKYFSQLDIAGYNYLPDKYESDHEAFPERIFYGSEAYPADALKNWRKVEELPYVIGDFVWTAMDYIGEVALGTTSYVEQLPHHYSLQDRDGLPEGTHPATLFDLMNSMSPSKWPLYISWCGDIDIIGHKKAQGIYRDVVWNESDIRMVVHEPIPDNTVEDVPAWGWPMEYASWEWTGNEGKPLQVRVFTHAPRVRLQLNGETVGETAVNDSLIAVFTVPYQSGELIATGLDADGNSLYSVSLSTPGSAAAIALNADRTQLDTDTGDLAFIDIDITDADGNIVTLADREIEIKVSGNGTLAASGNAGQQSMADVNQSRLHTYRGRAQAIIRPTGTAGDITITVSAAGLPQASLTIAVLH